MDLVARKKLNLEVLKRHDTNICDILDQSAHAVVYKFDTEKTSWEKLGYEGVIFLTKGKSAPYFGLYVLNRLSIENFSLHLTDFEEINLTDEFIIYQTSEGEACALWLFEKKDRERILAKILKLHEGMKALPSAQITKPVESKVDILQMLKKASDTSPLETVGTDLLKALGGSQTQPQQQRQPQQQHQVKKSHKQQHQQHQQQQKQQQLQQQQQQQQQQPQDQTETQTQTKAQAQAQPQSQAYVQAQAQAQAQVQAQAHAQAHAHAQAQAQAQAQAHAQAQAQAHAQAQAQQQQPQQYHQQQQQQQQQHIQQQQQQQQNYQQQFPIHQQHTAHTPSMQQSNMNAPFTIPTSDSTERTGNRLQDIFDSTNNIHNNNNNNKMSDSLSRRVMGSGELTKPFYPPFMNMSPAASPRNPGTLLQALHGGIPPPPPTQQNVPMGMPLMPQQVMGLMRPEVARRFGGRPPLTKPEFIQQLLNIIQCDPTFFDILYETYQGQMGHSQI